MIVYFADRYFNILGQASTSLPEGMTIKDDLKTEDIDTGVASFDCYIGYDSSCRSDLQKCIKAGNYILRSNGDESEFYTIIESEEDTGRQQCYVYAEDAGLDLLNEVYGDYSADKAYNIAHYVNKFAYDSGFVIKRNDIPSLTRKLSWEGNATATERLASVATQFDAEISYSFEIKGLKITNKYINIYKKRGQDLGCQLRINEEVDRIITKQSIANLATAYNVVGGTPEDSETPITLSGYKYDDGDFYVSGTKLLSRNALKKWSRYLWKDEPNQTADSGHIVKQFSYDTTSQSELCSRAVSSLKKVCDMEVNYEIDIAKLPENAKIGDTVNIVDDEGSLYLSTRILKLETSVTSEKRTATLGEFLIKGSGISQKVVELAAKFAKSTVSVSRALAIANAAKTAAASAQKQADTAISDAAKATTAANAAAAKAETATQSAAAATAAAQSAEDRVGVVESSVSSLETTVNNAQAAADNAYTAATTAQNKADAAATAAAEAKADAAAASAATEIAHTTAETAISKAETAQGTASTAQEQAAAASATAAAAKADAETAQNEINSLGERLETVSTTMAADYARKTDLTEAQASLQTQITQNASELSSTATKIQLIDETLNTAKEQAEQAQATADAAQAQADTATADAAAAQKAADDAAAAATAAQSQADSAKAAAATAQNVADKADADLAAAKADLATVQGRVDATETEIAAAQQAVATAQAAADKAKADATSAANAAAAAQTTADTAVTNAANAKAAADDAADKATMAQAAADAAKGDAAKAQTAADQAATAAATAQATANTAKTNAASAQAKADQAFADATAAQNAADAADAKAAQAAADLVTAKQNLEAVTSRVGATEEEVEAAKAAVVTAQAAADDAAAAATAAQSTADTAKANAAKAQTAADGAKTAADAAQAAADAAKDAADKAQADADALAVRVTSAETKITQNSEQIELRAKKTEVAETLGGYYTKEQTDAAINTSSDSIKSEVTSKIEGMKIGGRNYFSSKNKIEFDENNEYTLADYQETGSLTQFYNLTKQMSEFVGKKCILSFDVISPNGETAISVYNANNSPRYLMNASGIISPINTEWVHQTLTVTVTDRGDDEIYSESASDKIEFYCSAQIGCKIRNVKFEIGTKETDWTPAPEDVQESINKTAEELSQTILEQNTSITNTCESIILEALKSYTETKDFDSFKETVSSQLTLLTDEMTLQFSHKTEEIQALNDELNTRINEITKYFTFDVNGITIGQANNPYKVIIDNDRYSMTVNDVEVMWIADGKVYTPEIEITKAFRFFDFLIDKDSAGNVNCGYVGG